MPSWEPMHLPAVAHPHTHLEDGGAIPSSLAAGGGNGVAVLACLDRRA